MKEIHCKDCKYYIDYIDNPESVSKDVCGYFLRTEIDPVGREVFKKYGKAQYCDSCSALISDDRIVVTRSCLEINKDKNCKYYSKRRDSIIAKITVLFKTLGNRNASTSHK